MTEVQRLAKIKVLKDLFKEYELLAKYNGGTDYDRYSALNMAIKALEQQPCDDAISRDMALEKMADYVASGYADSAEDFEEYSKIICQLPSVTPTCEEREKGECPWYAG